MLLRSQERLRNALEPEYINLFSHISRLPDGVKFLVDLRRDLLVRYCNMGLYMAATCTHCTIGGRVHVLAHLHVHLTSLEPRPNQCGLSASQRDEQQFEEPTLIVVFSRIPQP